MVATPDFLPQTRLLDVDDYDRLPDDGPRYELIDGVLTEIPALMIFHQSVLAQYFEMLRAHVRRHRLGLVLFAPVDVELSHFDIVQPDLVFVSRDNGGVIRPDGRRIVGAPDLVVEASSPGTTLRDQGAKRRLYATHGVREYWFVDTDRRAQTTWVRDGDRLVERPSEGGRHANVALPGLVVDVTAILARADEDVAMVESPEEGVDGR